MNKIKKFSEFNEGLSQEEIDDILDKISSKGINSLSQSDRLKLDNLDKDISETKEDIISQISEIIDEHGMIGMFELGADSSPVYKQVDQSIDLIERLYSDHVEVVSYGGYKYETELNEYDVDYNKLDIETLIKIRDLLINFEP